MVKEFLGIRWRVISPSLYQLERYPQLTLEFVGDWWYLYVFKEGSARQFYCREDAILWLGTIAEEKGIIL